MLSKCWLVIVLNVLVLHFALTITDWKMYNTKRRFKSNPHFEPELLAHSKSCVCIPLKRCPALLSLLSIHPVHPTAIEFLTNQTCGFSGFDPYVCCYDMDDPNSPKPPNIPQPRAERCMSSENTPNNIENNAGTDRMSNENPTTTRFYRDNRIPNFPSRFRGGIFHPHPPMHYPPHETVFPTDFQDRFNAVPEYVEDEDKIATDEPATRSNLVPDDTCGLALDQRVVGGQDAKLAAYPWIARLGYTRSQSSRYLYRCGGTLINSRFVLTAAHCVKELPGNMKLASVRLGELDERTNPDCDANECADAPQDFVPIIVIVHRDYNQPKYKNDIALLKLDREASITPYVTPICLPVDSMKGSNYTGVDVTVAGWGVTNLALPASSPILQDLQLRITDTEACNTTYTSKFRLDVSGEQFCTIGDKGKDACEGDSGGPLMRKEQIEKNGVPRYYLLGIVSFGPKQCGTLDLPSVFTRVSSYLDWILKHID